jgi:hypothetical protein
MGIQITDRPIEVVTPAERKAINLWCYCLNVYGADEPETIAAHREMRRVMEAANR